MQDRCEAIVGQVADLLAIVDREEFTTAGVLYGLSVVTPQALAWLGAR